MKIKKVELCGFKSFVDKTALVFDHDITAVVGPNGCGKSNVVDAIRWAMGEQSARHLRGKSMDDVIFNGSETRGPNGSAQVTLIFDNTDGLSPPEYRDYAEIAVTRRLDRAGGSEYLINHTPVRLLDVTQLFLGTGVGTKAYSIIEQGRIGFIVSSKPEDRRYLIEEAAGVTKFKAKKRAAERKMDSTRQNLLRVGDIVSEIEKNITTLKRQAQKAERYKAYRSELRDLELLVASHQWLEASAELNLVIAQLKDASAELEAGLGKLQLRESELEAARLSVQSAEHELEKAQTKAYEFDNAVRTLEAETERQQDRLSTLQESSLSSERELASIGEQRLRLGDERDMLRSTITTLEEAEAAEKAALTDAQHTLESLKFEASQAEEATQTAQQRIGQLQAEVARIEGVLQNFDERQKHAEERLAQSRAEEALLATGEDERTGEVGSLRAELARLHSERAERDRRLGEHEQQLASLREQAVVAENHVESLRTTLAQRRSRMQSPGRNSGSARGCRCWPPLSDGRLCTPRRQPGTRLAGRSNRLSGPLDRGVGGSPGPPP